MSKVSNIKINNITLEVISTSSNCGLTKTWTFNPNERLEERTKFNYPIVHDTLDRIKDVIVAFFIQGIYEVPNGAFDRIDNISIVDLKEYYKRGHNELEVDAITIWLKIHDGIPSVEWYCVTFRDHSLARGIAEFMDGSITVYLSPDEVIKQHINRSTYKAK